MRDSLGGGGSGVPHVTRIFEEAPRANRLGPVRPDDVPFNVPNFPVPPL
jgi:hypothetical protein